MATFLSLNVETIRSHRVGQIVFLGPRGEVLGKIINLNAVRPVGRPKRVGPSAWEAAGLTRTTYYRLKKQGKLA